MDLIRDKFQYLRFKPFEGDTSDQRSKERYRRITLTTATSLIAKGISILSLFITVPLTLKYLGAERYGIWMTVSSMVAFLGFADLGVGSGLVNAVAEAQGKDDKKSIAELISTAFFCLLSLSIFSFITFLPLSYVIHWEKVFNIPSSPDSEEAAVAIRIFAGLVLLNIPLDVVNKSQTGAQEGYLANTWQTVGSLAGFFGVLACIHFHAGLPWLVLAATGGITFATFANFITEFLFRKPDFCPSLTNFTRIRVRSLFSTSSTFFLLYLVSVLSFSADNLIVAHVSGPRAVATYSVTQRLFSIVSYFQLYLAPMWPACGEALSCGDFAWVRDSLRKSLKVTLFIGVGLTGTLLLFGQILIHHWAGPTVNPSIGLLAGFAILTLITSYGGAISFLLNATQFLRRQLIYSGAAALLAITSKLILSKIIGLEGVVWGGVLGYAVAFVIPTVFLVLQICHPGHRSNLSSSDVNNIEAG